MAIHHHLPIYKQCYDLLTLASDVVRNMPRDFKAWAAGNSYLGLVRQAEHSHNDQARLARALLKRGHTINGHMTRAMGRTGQPPQPRPAKDRT